MGDVLRRCIALSNGCPIEGVKNFFASTFGSLFGRSTDQTSLTASTRASAAPRSQPTVGAGRSPSQPSSASSNISLDEDGWLMIDEDPLGKPSKLYSQDVTGDAPEYMSDANYERCAAIMSEEKINMDYLRAVAWQYGIHDKFRSMAWKIMLGVVPPWPYLYETILSMKRGYYTNYCKKYLKMVDSNEEERQLTSMIRSGLQNTALKIKLFRSKTMSHLLERIIYIWLKQNPNVSFHNGMTVLVLPIVYACLCEYGDITTLQPTSLSPQQLLNLEADSYLLFEAILECMKDFLSDSPDAFTGHVQKLREYVKLENCDLTMFFVEMEIHFLTFAFPWFESMLINSFQKLPLVVYIWDRYIASGKFVQFHVIVCAKILQHFTKHILKLESSGDVYYFLEHLPLHKWSYAQADVLLEAARESATFSNLVNITNDIDLEPLLRRWRKTQKQSEIQQEQSKAQQEQPNVQQEQSTGHQEQSKVQQEQSSVAQHNA